MNKILTATVILWCLAPLTRAEGTQPGLKHGFSQIVKRSLPAVVNVSSSRIVREGGGVQESLLHNPAMQQMRGDELIRYLQPQREERQQRLGSGVIVSPDGYILTNEHVVEGANHVKVALNDKREFEARVIGSDAKTDIAVLKIPADGLPSLRFGDSSKMRPGDFVLAIGDPYGLRHTVTLGIISATGRERLGIEDYEDFIQTDAPINPGGSGGPLINVNGQLIGINTAILSGGGGSEGISFAIPINMAREVMNQIRETGRVVHGWIGITTQPLTPAMAKAFGLPGQTYGALLRQAVPDSPAASAGLARGDIILELNGQRVADDRDLSLRISMLSPGSQIRLRMFHNHEVRDVAITLTEEPPNPKAPEGFETAEASGHLMDGIDTAELTADIAEHLRLPATTSGVMVSKVDPTSFAAEAGLQPGDVILEVNHGPVANVPQFEEAVQSAAEAPVLLLINRRGNVAFLLIEPD